MGSTDFFNLFLALPVAAQQAEEEKEQKLEDHAIIRCRLEL